MTCLHALSAVVVVDAVLAESWLAAAISLAPMIAVAVAIVGAATNESDGNCSFEQKQERVEE